MTMAAAWLAARARLCNTARQVFGGAQTMVDWRNVCVVTARSG
jgi:hypothetical protein